MGGAPDRQIAEGKALIASREDMEGNIHFVTSTTLNTYIYLCFSKPTVLAHHSCASAVGQAASLR